MDVEGLIAQAGLSPTFMKMGFEPQSVQAQLDFIALVAAALDDTAFGIHILPDIDFRDVGLLYYVMASATTLGWALRRVERYVNSHNEGVFVRVHTEDTIVVTFRCSDDAHPAEGYRILALIVALVDACRHLTGVSRLVTAVRLPTEIPAGKPELEEMLSSPVTTDADRYEIEFAAGSWNQPVYGTGGPSDSLLWQGRREARYPGTGASTVSRIEEIIVDLLPQGLARHHIIAERLGMSGRTLARRLADEGYEFSEILDKVRFSLAQRCLADPRMSISQVARHVGYTEIAAFSRAFKRRAGLAPSQARTRF